MVSCPKCTKNLEWYLMFSDSGIFVLGDVSLFTYSLAMISFNIWSIQTAKKATEEIYLFSFLMPKVTYSESIKPRTAIGIKPKDVSIATQISIEECLTTGVSSLVVPGVPWHTQILADQLTLFQPGRTDYAHLITTGTPGFSDLPTALVVCTMRYNFSS